MLALTQIRLSSQYHFCGSPISSNSWGTKLPGINGDKVQASSLYLIDKNHMFGIKEDPGKLAILRCLPVCSERLISFSPCSPQFSNFCCHFCCSPSETLWSLGKKNCGELNAGFTLQFNN